jgi:hypothetical protein
MKNLLRSDGQNLFKWSKQGILLKLPYNTLNISLMDPNEVIDILDNLLENEITIHQKIDLKEMIQYIKNN